MQRMKAGYEYLRAFRFELGVLSKFDRVQVCSPANASYLTSFVPKLAGRIDDRSARRYRHQPVCF